MSDLPLHPCHPDYPVLSRDELLLLNSQLIAAIESCGASQGLTTAVCLANEFGYHLRRYIDNKSA